MKASKIVHVFIAISFLVSSALYFLRGSSDIQENVPNIPLNDSFPIIFYHNAYVDYRYTPPRLRIFSLNTCIKKNNFLSVDIFYESESDRVEVHGEPLAGNCPSKYHQATSCLYSAHSFYTDLMSPRGIDKITIHLGNRHVNLSVKEIKKPSEDGITVCLQPVHYYSLWQNIILYIESWRAQGANRFIVFYHSATKEVRKVLDYYQRLGLLELRPWPKFPNLSSNIADKYPKVDDSVYSFSYFLAMNICILDIKTTMGTVADFDEVLVPRNGRLIEYATKEMMNMNIGALSFENNYVVMEPSIYTSNFSGVLSPVLTERRGPTKYIFKTAEIDIAETHWPKSFIDASKTTKTVTDGALLHFRFDAVKRTKVQTSHWYKMFLPKFFSEKVTKPFRFFPDNSFKHLQNMHDTANFIFNGSLPTFLPKLIDGINECVENIKEKTCRSTGGKCREHMDRLADWVYDTTEDIFLAGGL